MPRILTYIVHDSRVIAGNLKANLETATQKTKHETNRRVLANERSLQRMKTNEKTYEMLVARYV